jgi:dUTP pyrophosphatase
VKKLRQRATLPTCSNPGEDLAFDIYADQDVLLHPGKVSKIHTGIAAQFAPWAFVDSWPDKKKYGLLIRDRSSLAAKGITVSGGVVDSSYSGEIIVLLTLEPETDLHWTEDCDDNYCSSGQHAYPGYKIKAGDKVAQLIPVEVFTGVEIRQVEELPFQKRGDKGFGSTGK